MLDLTLRIGEGAEYEAAWEAYTRMRRDEWKQFVTLAAHVVAVQEQVATGQVFLVAPVHQEHLAAVVAARK